MLVDRIRCYFKPEIAQLEVAEIDERRSAVRKSVLLRATIYPVDVFSDVRICDVSATGAKGEADVELALGQTLHITIDEKNYHAGTVRWTRDRQFGIDLSDADRIFGAYRADVDHGDEEGHNPRSSRIPTNLTARLVGGRPPRPAMVRNMSVRGMLLETGPGIQPGQHLVVRIGNASPIYGRAQWSDNGKIGFKAHNAISVLAITCAVD